MKPITILILCLTFSVSSFSKTILFLGDSLTEGYRLPKEYSYPSLVETKLKENISKDFDVVNGGVSGSTTGDGISRLKWYLKKKPDVMVLALGANDGLRGLDLKKSKANLIKMINLAKESGAKVLMMGMLLPPNFGPEYTKSFKKMYLDVSKENNIPLMPFLLKGVAGNKKLNLADGIHPNREGYKIVAQNVYNFLKDKI